MSSSVDRPTPDTRPDMPSVVPLSDSERSALLASIDRQLAAIEQRMLDQKLID